MKKVLYLLFILISFLSYSQDKAQEQEKKKIEVKKEDQVQEITEIKGEEKKKVNTAKKRVKRREEKLKQIVERELSIAERTMKYSANLGDISLRLLSAYSDKMRIVKKDENRNYLNNKDPNIKRETFFKQSRGLERESRNSVVDYINKNGEFADVDRIYLTLALNSRDYGDGEHTLKFLKKARDLTKDRETLITVQTILGDYYYNDKKFHLAIKYYELITSDDDVEWWTKYAYNLAWCYLKRKKHQKALVLLKEVIKRSKMSKYIDYSSIALDKAGIFYVYAHKESEGVNYLLSAAKKPAKYLVSMAIFLMSREENAKSEYVLKTAYEKGDRAEKAEVNLYLMQLYEKQRMNKRVYTVAKKMFNEKLVKELNEVQIGEFEIYLKNLIVYHDEKINKVKRTKESYYAITQLYKYLIKLGVPSKSFFYYRLSLLNNLYKDNLYALKYAEQALAEYTTKVENLDKEALYKLVIGELNTTCKQKRKTKKECREQKEKYYNAYLADFQKGELAQDTYVGLFYISMERKDLTKAELVLDKFTVAFPKEKERQRNLMKNILEYYQKKKDLPQLQRLQAKISGDGLFKGASGDTQTLKNVVSGLAFEQTVGLLKTAGAAGLPLAAIGDFKGIYSDTGNTQELRMRSALNIGLTNYQHKKHTESISWLKKAIDLMTPAQLNKQAKQLLTITDGFFSRGDLTSTQKYSTILFKDLCGKTKRPLDTLYEKNILSLYYSGNEGEAIRLLNFNYPCTITQRVKNKLIQNLITMSSEFGGIESLEKLKPFVGKRTVKLYTQAVFDHYNHLNEWKKKKNWKRITNLVDTSKPPFSYYATSDQFIVDTNQFIQRGLKADEYLTAGKFDEAKFDSVINTRIKGIESLAKRGQRINRSKIPEIQYVVVDSLSRAYKSMGEMISSVSAVGMPADYQKAFKEQMVGFAGGMTKEGNNYLNQKNKLQEQEINTSTKDLALSKVFSVFQEERILRYDIP